MSARLLTVSLAQDWSWSGPGLAQGSAAAALRPDEAPALPDALLQAWRRSGLRVSVRVCVSHARLLLLPASDELYSEARWLRYARGRLDSLQAGAAGDWELRWLVEPPGAPRLLAALPKCWSAALSDAFGGRLQGLRIDALERLGRLRADEPRYSGAMLDLGPNHALLVMLVDGRPVRVRPRRGAPSLEDLRSMLASEWAVLAAGTPGLDERLPRLAVGSTGSLSADDCAALAGLASHWQRSDD